MDHNDFAQLGQLLAQWAAEQARCKYRVYGGCDHPRNNYGGCGLYQCPNPRPRKDGKNIYPEGTTVWFWIQENPILFRKFDDVLD